MTQNKKFLELLAIKNQFHGEQSGARISSRAERTLFLLSVNIFEAAVNITIGTVDEVADIFSFGHFPSGSRLSRGCNHILAEPFKNVIHILNPDAHFPPHTKYYVGMLSIAMGGDAYVSRKASKNVLVKHVVGRICALTSCLAFIVARIVF